MVPRALRRGAADDAASGTPWLRINRVLRGGLACDAAGSVEDVEERRERRVS